MRSSSLILLASAFVARAAHNITIDDTSPLITYSGQWITGAPTSLDYGGTHQYSTDPSAIATFTFTGVAVYYMSPLWPYPVTTMLSLDGAVPVLVNLQDPSPPPIPATFSETVPSKVVWGMSGLANTQHTLIASMQGSSGEVEMDGLVYTVLDASNTSPPPLNPATPTKSPHPPAKSSSHPTPPTHTPSPTPTNSTKKVTTAILGVLGGLCFVTIFIVAGCMAYRRRRVNNNRPTLLPLPNTPHTPGSGSEMTLANLGRTGTETGEDGSEIGGNVAPFLAGYPHGSHTPYPFSAEQQQQQQQQQSFTGLQRPSSIYKDKSGTSSTSQNRGYGNNINHPYVYASAGNAFGSDAQGQQQQVIPTQARASTYSNFTQPFLPNPFEDGTLPPGSSPSRSNNAYNPTNRMSTTTTTGRESIVGLAYLSSSEPEPEPVPATLPTQTRPRTMAVVNGDNTDSGDPPRFNEKSDQTSVPTQRQEDEMVPPPPAYS